MRTTTPPRESGAGMLYVVYLITDVFFIPVAVSDCWVMETMPGEQTTKRVHLVYNVKHDF